MKNLSRIVLLCVAIFGISPAMATKIVFLGDSNTALIYLNPKNNPNITRDQRFTTLVGNNLAGAGVTTVNSAVGGAKTKDFLEGGKYFSHFENSGWDKRGDIYVICFGLNDAPQRVEDFQRTSSSVLLKFERETWSLVKTILRYNPRAKISLMTNVPVNFGQEDFQYSREIIIDAYDGVYRKMSNNPRLGLLDVNNYLKRKVINGFENDLRIRRSSDRILNGEKDYTSEAQSVSAKLWRTNIHYNTAGSAYVAEFLTSAILR